MTGQVFVSGGFGPLDERYPHMSPGLRARVAASDAEFDRQSAREETARRVAVESAHERAVLAAAQAKAAAEGLPLHQAMRQVGRTKSEALSYYSALQDLEDAQRAARYRQQLRHAGIDPDSGEPIEVPQPPAREVELAARMMRSGDDPAAVGRGLRAKWLRREHRRDLR